MGLGGSGDRYTVAQDLENIATYLRKSKHPLLGWRDCWHKEVRLEIKQC